MRVIYTTVGRSRFVYISLNKRFLILHIIITMIEFTGEIRGDVIGRLIIIIRTMNIRARDYCARAACCYYYCIKQQGKQKKKKQKRERMRERDDNFKLGTCVTSNGNTILFFFFSFGTYTCTHTTTERKNIHIYTRAKNESILNER